MKISVVIPTRNRHLLAQMAIESVLLQTYDNLEIIVSDNSTDCYEAANDLRMFCSQNNVIYYRTNGNLSMLQNWNFALSKINGDFFLRLDDDNILFSDALENLLLLMLDEKLDVLTGSNLISGFNAKISNNIISKAKCTLLTRHDFILAEYQNKSDSNYTMYKTELLTKTGIDKSQFYQTRLPDRGAHFKISDLMHENKIRVAYTKILCGLTRFDYREEFESTKEIDLSDGLLSKSEIIEQKNVLQYFNVHRLLFLEEIGPFLSENTNDFINKKIMNKKLYQTFARHMIIKTYTHQAILRSRTYRYYSMLIFKDLMTYGAKKYNCNYACLTGITFVGFLIRNFLSPPIKTLPNIKVKATDIDIYIKRYLATRDKSIFENLT